MNNILIQIKNSDQILLHEALASLEGKVDIAYPSTKVSEFLVILSLDRLLELESAVPSIKIIQIYEK
jgi:hypothetical protein